MLSLPSVLSFVWSSATDW